jgi:hypothetical protein|tara:strand:+ start:2058 stop:2411 length:354 start_codon:yes stop_codon:yes gene_type:complete
MGRLSKIKLELIQEANKRLLGEDVETVIPNFKATDGMLSIGSKLYKLTKGWFNITIHNVIVEKNGDVKLDASAMGLPRQTNIVGKPNIDKVVTAVEKGQREIKVKNKGGTEFTLTKV